MSSFNYTRNNDTFKIIKKQVNYTNTPKVNNNGNTLNISQNLSLSVLSLNGNLVTSSGTQLNYISATPGTANSNKALIVDSNRNITNINSIGCNNLVVNGSNITVATGGGTASESNSPYLQKIISGEAKENKILTLDNNRNVKNINTLSVEKLNFKTDIQNNKSQIYKKKYSPTSWNQINTTYSNNLTDIVWSDELNLGVIISDTGNNERIFTSTNGTDWTPRSTPANNNFKSIVWSPQLTQFVTVSSSGNNRVMTSSDGINWTARNTNIYTTSISSGRYHTSFLNNNGSIYSCGLNVNGELANGDSSLQSIPILITSINNVSKIENGLNFSIFLLNDGTVKSIGNNTNGALGNGNNINQSIIQSVYNLTNVTAISVSANNYHSLALLYDNTIQAWGLNTSGQLGNNNTISSNIPVTVSGINNATAISAGFNHSLALLSDGTIKSWGNNSNGQLGNNSTTSSNIPVTVSGISNAIAIAAGNGFSLALLSDGTIKSWGINNFGQLGDTTTTQRLTPVTVSGINNAISITTCDSHSLALLSDGTVKTWGKNDYYQLGDGTVVQKSTPFTITGISNAIFIEAGFSQSFVILNDNTILRWGLNTNGQLGDGSTSNITTPSGNLDLWTLYNDWSSVCWSPELSLYVAVANSGNVRVMTSSNGINWSAKTVVNNNWNSICWSNSLNIFVAVSDSGSQRVMTSPNGINWTLRNSANNSYTWKSVTWSPFLKLFAAVSLDGYIMTSPDGISWFTRTRPSVNQWNNIKWISNLNLFLICSSTGTRNRIGYSFNGTDWNISYSIIDSELVSLVWANSINRFIVISRNTIVYSNFINQNTNIMTNTNWYTLFNRINNAWTITQSGSDPDVEIQLNSSNNAGANPNLWYLNRIQDMSSVTINFEIKMSGTANATSFNIGFNSTSFYGDGSNNPAFCIAFRIYSGAGTYCFIGSSQVGSTGPNINDNNWKTVQIIYNNSTINTWTVTLNGSNILSYSDPNHASWLANSGNYFGFGSRNGALTHNAYIRRFNLTGIILVPQTTTILDSKIFNSNIYNYNTYNVSNKAYYGLTTNNQNILQTYVPTLANTIYSVCWSSNLKLMVAVGTGGTSGIYTSSDGFNWTQRTAPNTNIWTSVCYSPELNLFVAVSKTGTNNRVITSPNGITWTARTSAADNNWNSICWSSELLLFVAVANGGPSNTRIMTSNNGINWTGITTSASAWDIICWSKEVNMFIITGSSNLILNSYDGINWFNPPNYSGINSRAICWSKELNMFVSLAYDSNAVRYSYDGLNWLSSTSAGSNNWTSVCWSVDLGLFLAVGLGGNANRFMISYNGINWKSILTSHTGNNASWYSIIWISELNNFIGITTNYVLSLSNYLYNHLSINNSCNLSLLENKVNNKVNPNYLIWDKNSTNTNLQLSSICYSSDLNLLVAISTSGYNNRVLTSTDSIIWITQVSAANNNWTSICYSPELTLFVAVSNSGYNNRVMTSTNAINWVSRTSASNNNWTSICWSSDLSLFVAVSNSGINNRVMTSSDGITWTSQISATNNNWTSIVWSSDLDLFVAVSNSGTNNRVMTSSDGITWTSQVSASDNNWTSVCYSSELTLFVAVSETGTSNRVMTSPDGINWTSRTSAVDNKWKSVCYSPDLDKFVALSVLSSYSIPILDTNNWYNIFNKIKMSSGWTITQSGSNPDVELHLNNSSFSGSTGLWHQERIQDYNNLAINFEIKLSGGADATSFNIGYNNAFFTGDFIGDGPNAPAFCLVFQLFTYGGRSLGIYFFLNGLQIGFYSVNVGDNIWNAVQILYTKGTYNTWVVNYKGINLFNYSDSNNNSWLTSSGNYFGFASRNGAETHDSYIRRFSLSYELVSTENIMTSSNGINWTSQSFSAITNWTSLIWANNLNLFIAVSDSRIMTSADAINWNYKTLNNFSSICYSSDLNLLVVLNNIGNNRVMTSNDGINWISRSTPVDNTWTSICYSSELNLFVAVSNTGTNNRVMTSNNGINWTIRTSAADNNWTSIIWVSELNLFVAISNTGTNNRIMTSPDGITWTSRVSPVDNNWSSICYSSELNLLVAVSNSGTNNRVMTSPDGIVWTTRTSAADNNWTSICYSSELLLFVAVSNSGTNDRIMTSNDGINWVSRNSINNNNYIAVSWSDEFNLFVAIANSGNNRLLISNDGINWVSKHSLYNNDWINIIWADNLGKFIALSNDNINNILYSKNNSNGINSKFLSTSLSSFRSNSGRISVGLASTNQAFTISPVNSIDNKLLRLTYNNSNTTNVDFIMNTLSLIHI